MIGDCVLRRNEKEKEIGRESDRDHVRRHRRRETRARMQIGA